MLRQLTTEVLVDGKVVPFERVLAEKQSRIEV